MEQKVVAIYARSNTGERGTSQSIDAQVNECMAVAKQKYGENVRFEIYKDEAVVKAALCSLIQDVGVGRIKVVIMTDLNRLNRSRQ